MSDFLKDALFVALGYAVGQRVSKSDIQKSVDGYLKDAPVWSVVNDLARAKGVYVRSQGFYEELVQAAKSFEDPYAK